MSECLCDVVACEGIVTTYSEGEIMYLHETSQLIVCPTRCLRGFPGRIEESTFWSVVASATSCIVEGDGTEAMPVNLVTVCLACRG